MKLSACFLMLSVVVCSAALADEPQSPAAKTPAQAPAQPAVQPSGSPASASTTAAPASASSTAASGDTKPVPGAPAPKADKSEAIDAAATDAEIKQMRSRGYKPVNRNGTLVFCRDEGELGSHFQRTHCSTLKQLKDAELSGKEYVNSIQQQGGPVINKP